MRPRRTFSDVILPDKTIRALDQALAQVTSHDFLIFRQWGLGDAILPPFPSLQLSGPSGTGNTSAPRQSRMRWADAC